MPTSAGFVTIDRRSKSSTSVSFEECSWNRRFFAGGVGVKEETPNNREEMMHVILSFAMIRCYGRYRYNNQSLD